MTRSLTTLLAIPLILAGCDSVAPGTDEAPPPPPPSAFALDADLAAPSARRAAGSNFLHAAGRYGVVSVVVGANLAIPAAVTAAATSAEPTVEDGTWIWERTTTVQNADVTFRLEGTPEGREVDWRMRITSVDGGTGQIADDFDLYTATTSLDGTLGSWALSYVLDGGPTRVLTADFEVRAEDDREVTFRVPDGREAGGSSVLYRVDGDARIFDWTAQPGDVRTRVEWDSATRVGFLEADDYNDGARACWDESLNDTACESA